MSDVINFRQQRKVKARTEKEKQASQNRAKFGRTKEEKKLEKLKSDLAKKHLEGHKRENEDE